MAWNSVNVVGGFAMQILRGIILARLLAPEDFGIVGGAIGFTAILQNLVGLGLASAITQAKELRQEAVNAAFTIQLATALFACGCLAMLAPSLSAWYEVPQLNGVLTAFGIGVVLNVLVGTPHVLLARELRFKEINLILGAARLVSFVLAVVLAATGFGYWSLVLPDLISRVMMWPLLANCLGHMPRLTADLASIKPLISCSTKSYGNLVVASLNTNLDYVLLSSSLSTRDFGFYFFGYQRVRGPLRTGVTTIRSALFPALCHRQDSARSLDRAFNKTVPILAAFLLPLATLILLLMEPLVQLVFGKDWVPSVGAMKWFTVWMYFIPVGLYASTALTAQNKHGVYFWEGALRALCIVVALGFLGYRGFSVTSCAAAVATIEVLGIVVTTGIATSRLQISPRRLVAAYVPGVAAATALLFVDQLMLFMLPQANTSIQSLGVLLIRVSGDTSAAALTLWLIRSEIVDFVKNAIRALVPVDSRRDSVS